jgi:dTDP-4-dehydrorhamnose 3,5-epimerase
MPPEHVTDPRTRSRRSVDEFDGSSRLIRGRLVRAASGGPLARPIIPIAVEIPEDADRALDIAEGLALEGLLSWSPAGDLRLPQTEVLGNLGNKRHSPNHTKGRVARTERRPAASEQDHEQSKICATIKIRTVNLACGKRGPDEVMAMIGESELIRDVLPVIPDVHGDERGRFVETYRRSWFPLGREMVQANRSEKLAGSVVGLHYHLHQADYWYVTRGIARVVLHDLRVASPTEKATEIVELGADEHGLFIPPGVAHGFAALSDLTLIYLVDGYYNPADELGVAWNDPDIAADWGIADPVVSERDQRNPARRSIPDHLVPRGVLRT